MKVSPSRVWMTMLYEVLTNVYNILFTVVFFAYFVQCVIDQKPIGFMITVVGAVTICGLLVEAFGGWYRTIYIKQSDLKITCAIINAMTIRNIMIILSIRSVKFPQKAQRSWVMFSVR